MKRHSTITLMGMTKAELVEYVRVCEHNREVAEQTLAQHIENVKDWQFVEPQFRKPLEILRKNFEEGINSEWSSSNGPLRMDGLKSLRRNISSGSEIKLTASIKIGAEGKPSAPGGLSICYMKFGS